MLYNMYEYHICLFHLVLFFYVIYGIDFWFQSMAKTLMNIACNLNHNKEMRDLFMDLVEKVATKIGYNNIFSHKKIYFHNR